MKGDEFDNLMVSVRRAVADLSAGLTRMRRGLEAKHSSESLREARSKARYTLAIEHERKIGMRFVQNEAARVRRELGLDA